MALGTGTKVIGGKTVVVGQARRPVFGAPGLVAQGLTVQLRGPGGYRSNTKTVPAHPSRIRTDTFIRKPVLNVPHVAATKRGGSSDSALRLKSRAIIAAKGTLHSKFAPIEPIAQRRNVADSLGVTDSNDSLSA